MVLQEKMNKRKEERNAMQIKWVKGAIHVPIKFDEIDIVKVADFFAEHGLSKRSHMPNDFKRTGIW